MFSHGLSGLQAAGADRVSYERGVREYIKLQHPTLEQRFRFQRWHAEAAKLPEVRENIKEGRIDYKMVPEAYDIRFADWSKRAEFGPAAYVRSGDGVLFRGQRFEPGDILATNLASDSDGVYTTLTERRNSFSHVAVFVMLPGDFPAVLEIHDEGVRALPLKFYLSDRFSSYVEIYRFRRFLPAARAALGAIALKLTEEHHGFDFFLDEKQNHYLTCALTIMELFRRAGQETIPGASRYSYLSRPNMRILGNERDLGRLLLLPDDFTVNDRLRLVGVVDNDRFEKVQARALMRDRVQELFHTMQLDEARFPYDYHVYRLAVASIQSRGWGSSLLLAALGFHDKNFPSGPAVFLALAKPALERMEHGSREVALKLPREKLFQHSTWEETQRDPEVRALVIAASRDFAEMFSARPATQAKQ